MALRVGLRVKFALSGNSFIRSLDCELVDVEITPQLAGRRRSLLGESLSENTATI